MRTPLIATVALVVAGVGVTRADSVVINNGLAPPNPENVIDHGAYSGDGVYARNVGCPPGWPGGSAHAPCPSPGAPTEVAFTNGGVVEYLGAHDSSTITMDGGVVEVELDTYDSSTAMIGGGTVSGPVQATGFSSITMSGGILGWGLAGRDSSTVTVNGGTVEIMLTAWHSSTVIVTGGEIVGRLVASDSSTVTISGGTVGDHLRANGSSIVTIEGEDFMVDTGSGPVAVSYGDLNALTGRLTGTLACGDPIDNLFYQGGYTASPCSVMYPCSGIITLEYVPEPTQAVLSACALATLALLRRRRALR